MIGEKAVHGPAIHLGHGRDHGLFHGIKEDSEQGARIFSYNLLSIVLDLFIQRLHLLPQAEGVLFVVGGCQLLLTGGYLGTFLVGEERILLKDGVIGRTCIADASGETGGVGGDGKMLLAVQEHFEEDGLRWRDDKIYAARQPFLTRKMSGAVVVQDGGVCHRLDLAIVIAQIYLTILIWLKCYPDVVTVLRNRIKKAQTGCQGQKDFIHTHVKIAIRRDIVSLRRAKKS